MDDILYTPGGPTIRRSEVEHTIDYLDYMASCCESVMARGLDNDVFEGVLHDRDRYLEAASVLNGLINPDTGTGEEG